jgi:hypothetical protein
MEKRDRSSIVERRRFVCASAEDTFPGSGCVVPRLRKLKLVVTAVGLVCLLLGCCRADRYIEGWPHGMREWSWPLFWRYGSLAIAALGLRIGLGLLTRVRPLPDPGKCGCGYDLTGNVSGRCPECGTPIGRPLV